MKKLINLFCFLFFHLTCSQAQQFNSSGTGFFISPNGVFITAKHVIENKSRISIIYKGRLFDAATVKVDDENDLAILKINYSPVSYLKISNSDNIPIGLQIYTLGYPQLGIQGLSPKFTAGIINSDRGSKGNIKYFQFSAGIQKGNSGGPLIAPDGTVIGVVESKLTEILNANGVNDAPQNINYALKANFLINLIKNEADLEIKSINPKDERRPFEIFRDIKDSIFPILTMGK